MKTGIKGDGAGLVRESGPVLHRGCEPLLDPYRISASPRTPVPMNKDSLLEVFSPEHEIFSSMSSANEPFDLLLDELEIETPDMLHGFGADIPHLKDMSNVELRMLTSYMRKLGVSDDDLRLEARDSLHKAKKESARTESKDSGKSDGNE